MKTIGVVVVTVGLVILLFLAGIVVLHKPGAAREARAMDIERADIKCQHLGGIPASSVSGDDAVWFAEHCACDNFLRMIAPLRGHACFAPGSKREAQIRADAKERKERWEREKQEEKEWAEKAAQKQKELAAWRVRRRALSIKRYADNHTCLGDDDRNCVLAATREPRPGDPERAFVDGNCCYDDE